MGVPAVPHMTVRSGPHLTAYLFLLLCSGILGPSHRSPSLYLVVTYEPVGMSVQRSTSSIPPPPTSTAPAWPLCLEGGLALPSRGKCFPPSTCAVSLASLFSAPNIVNHCRGCPRCCQTEGWRSQATKLNEITEETRVLVTMRWNYNSENGKGAL